MGVRPPAAVEAAYLSPTATLTRRCEIYESDGETLFLRGNDLTGRLVDGTINADYTRDERRTIDCTLDNFDGALTQDPINGFWYDKILKFFMGIQVNQPGRSPKIVVIEDIVNLSAGNLRAALTPAGFGDIRIDQSVATLADLAGYEIVVSLANNNFTTKGTLLQQAFNAGMSIFTVGNRNTETQLPLIIASHVSKATSTYYQMHNDNTIIGTLGGGWQDFQQSNASGGTYITGLATNALPISVVTLDAQTVYTAVYLENDAGGRWVHLHDPGFGDAFAGSVDFVRTAFTYLNPYVPIAYWETQVGEFMIDSITSDNFPPTLSVQGRDYTKKLITSKFTQATTFVATDNWSPEGLIFTLAVNAGIDPTRIVLPNTGIVIPADITWDGTSSRMDAIKSLSDAYSLEVFFDKFGYLIVREFLDPLLSPISYEFATGPTVGNLVTFQKATSDADLYNHIVVTGDSSDSTTLPAWAEARNDEPSSPTRIARIGDRVLQYSNALITTDDQAQTVADTYLQIYAQQDYDFNFTSISFPWLEVGEVSRVIDPDASDSDPDRFLLISIDLPFALGPMSGDAKRVTLVGS